jgi:hypothetical protein
MGQFYEIGLQAGKDVAKEIDAFIVQEHKSDKAGENFDPEKRYTLDDGTSVYFWYQKWMPDLYSQQDRLLKTLNKFDNESMDKEISLGHSIESKAWKLVAVGDEGGFDEYGNLEGFEEFDGLYQSTRLVLPSDTNNDTLNDTVTPRYALIVSCSFDQNRVYLFDTMEKAIAALKYCYNEELHEQKMREDETTSTYSHTIAEDSCYARFIYTNSDGTTDTMDWTVCEVDDSKDFPSN